MNNILEKIDLLCVEKGWSYYDLGLASGVSANVIYNWKRRNSLPTIPVLERLCSGFSITLEQFFCDFNTAGLTADDSKLLQDWACLNQKEKEAVMFLISTFKDIKSESNG